MYIYIVCYSVYCDYFGVLIDCCVSELHAKLCPHHNVRPEIVYCCLQELHCLPNCLHAFMITVMGCHHVTKFHYSAPSGF